MKRLSQRLERFLKQFWPEAYQASMEKVWTEHERAEGSLTREFSWERYCQLYTRPERREMIEEFLRFNRPGTHDPVEFQHHEAFLNRHSNGL